MSSKTKTKGQAKSCPTTPIRKKADSRTVEDKVDLAEIVSNSFDSPSATAPTAAKVTTVPKKDRKSLAQEEVEGSASKLIFGRSSPGSVVNVDSKVEKVYKIVKKATGSLGGNGCNGPIYGELTMHSMQKIVNILITKCNFSHKSRFIDVGSGLGKPNFHVSQDPAVRLSLGVELEEIRWQLGMYNLHQVLRQVESSDDTGDENSSPENTTKKSAKSAKADNSKLNGCVNFIHNDIDEAKSTDPFTHIYQFDLGFPPPLQQSIAMKFNNSMHAEYLISFRPPDRVINLYGFKVEILDQISTSMFGSGESHTAYFYKRANSPPTTPSNSLKKLLLPPRSNFSEEALEVYCDNAFYDASKLAVELKKDALQQHVTDVVIQYQDSARPKRERKPTKL